MEEKYLTYKEIIETIKENHLFTFSLVYPVISSSELNDYIKQKYGENYEHDLKYNNDSEASKHSGLMVDNMDISDEMYYLTRYSIREFFLKFKTKEELIAFAKRYEKRPLRRYDTHDHEPLKEETKNNLKEQFSSLSSNQVGALIMYKSRMFQIMNTLWEKYQNSTSCNSAEIKEVITTDYSKKPIFDSYYVDKSTPKAKKQIAERNKQVGFQKLVKDQYKFFKKASQNPKNQKFFSMISLDLTNELTFVKSIIYAMNEIENIDQIRAPEDLKLYRGIYGTSQLSSISNSAVASCTPVFTTAADFAMCYVAGSYREGSNSVLCLNVEKGTPIIPLFFSIKTTIKGIDPEIMMYQQPDFDKINSEDILIELKNSGDIQQEILLPCQHCKVTGLDENHEDFRETSSFYPNMRIKDPTHPDYQGKQKDSYAYSAEDKAYETKIDEIQRELDIDKNLRFNNKPVVRLVNPSFTHRIYHKVSVKALEKSQNNEPGSDA